MRSAAKRRAWLLLAAGICGCAPSTAQTRVVSDVRRGAYADALATYRAEAQDRAVLRAWAEAILLQDAEHGDAARQHAAFSELTLLGTRARPLLDRLLDDERTQAVNIVQARALSQLMQLGDGAARAELRKLVDDKDADIVDLAYAALDRDRAGDAARLRTALAAPRSARRLIALRALSSEVGAKHLNELAEISRLDPQPSVRAAALLALARYGTPALFAFERALREESDSSVRVVAIEAFARALPGSAVAPLDQQLGAAVSVESLSAAVALLQMHPAQETARAHDALVSALSSGDAALRARAALLVPSLPEAQRPLAAVRAQLSVETLDEVKLTLALLLGASDPQAHAALQGLATGSTLTAAQAAFELARLGDGAARTHLISLHNSPTRLTRITVARLVGRGLREPAVIADLLADGDADVRTAAAGAVLGGD